MLYYSLNKEISFFHRTEMHFFLYATTSVLAMLSTACEHLILMKENL